MDGWKCAQSNCGGVRCEKVEPKFHCRRFLWLPQLAALCHWTPNWKWKQLLIHPEDIYLLLCSPVLLCSLWMRMKSGESSSTFNWKCPLFIALNVFYIWLVFLYVLSASLPSSIRGEHSLLGRELEKSFRSLRGRGTCAHGLSFMWRTLFVVPDTNIIDMHCALLLERFGPAKANVIYVLRRCFLLGRLFCCQSKSRSFPVLTGYVYLHCICLSCSRNDEKYYFIVVVVPLPLC